MFDARTFPKSLKDAEHILLDNKADYKGDYIITDKIYASKDSHQSLGEVFMRLRFVSKNIWGEKPFIVAVKNTELKSLGKQSVIPLKRQFDTEAEALKFIEEELSEKFEFSYEFDRTGRQYFLGEDGVDLEDIEGHPSIEFKSPSEAGLQKLLSLFGVQQADVIRGPSVVAIKDLLIK